MIATVLLYALAAVGLIWVGAGIAVAPPRHRAGFGIVLVLVAFVLGATVDRGALYGWLAAIGVATFGVAVLLSCRDEARDDLPDPEPWTEDELASLLLEETAGDDEPEERA